MNKPREFWIDSSCLELNTGETCYARMCHVFNDQIREHDTHVIEKKAYDDALKMLEEMAGAAEIGLSFAPKGPVPSGLAPMFYHTLEYSSEVELQNRIDRAREALDNYRKWKEGMK